MVRYQVALEYKLSVVLMGYSNAATAVLQVGVQANVIGRYFMFARTSVGGLHGPLRRFHFAAFPPALLFIQGAVLAHFLSI